VLRAGARAIYGRGVAVAARVPRAGSARSADVMLLTVVLLWSGNFTAMRYAIGSFHPLAFSAVRFALGATLYALVVLLREGSLRIARRDLKAILLLAAIGIFANQVAVIYAVKQAGAANVGMLMASAPIIAALLARKLGHERIGRRHVAGIAVAATGALLVLYGGGGVGGAPLVGWFLGLLTAATWSSYSVLLRPLMARYSAERLSAAVLLTGSAMLIPVSLPQIAEQDWSAPSPRAWLAMAYSLVFSLLVTNVLWFDAIHRVGAARATVFLYLEPFCVAVIAMLVLGEHVSAAEWVGGVVILAGVLVARRGEEPGRRPRSR
jgi:drug/metabolite transporter (DMT)-like permease